MEENVASRRSVAELAGRFKASAPPPDAAGNKADKLVRRRPPRSLQLPETHGDVQEKSSGVTSPLPAKAKRNSALIEKLQANLALSPSALIPCPKSPGFRMPSPISTMVTTSSSTTPTSPESLITAFPQTEEQRPASFEAPPTVVEGSILSNINKGRARLSIRRRPPSRRHRKSSSGDDGGVANDGTDTPPCSPATSESKVEGGGDVFIQNESLCPKSKTERDKPEEDDQSEDSVKPRGDDEEKKSTSVKTKEDDPVSAAADPSEETTKNLRS